MGVGPGALNTLNAWRDAPVASAWRPSARWRFGTPPRRSSVPDLSYVLRPQGGLGTRLLLKVVMQATRFSVALSLGDLVMARRQMLNIKRLAELGPRGAT